MTRYAVIQAGSVFTVTEADEALDPNWVECDETVGSGDLYDGQTFTKAPSPATKVPAKVPMAAARIVLLRHGIADADVRSAIAAMTNQVTAAEALIDWEFRAEVRRASPLVAVLGPALHLDAGQIDAMFIEAEAIE